MFVLGISIHPDSPDERSIPLYPRVFRILLRGQVSEDHCFVIIFYPIHFRINQKRIRRRNVTRLDSVRSLDWVSASRYNTGHGDNHSTLSSRLPPSPASASPLRRISSYSPPHCLHTQSPRVSSVTSYPVVTPSAAATSFAGPRPTPVPLIPHANYSSYCTAGQAIASSQSLVTFSANVPHVQVCTRAASALPGLSPVLPASLTSTPPTRGQSSCPRLSSPAPASASPIK